MSVSSPVWRDHLVQQAQWVMELLNPDGIVLDETFTAWGYDHHPQRKGPLSPGGIELMRRLGYERYGAQGGDWGALITTQIGLRDPDHLAGIHVNMPVAIPPIGQADPNEGLTDAEKATLAEMEQWNQNEAGYQRIQGTKPQTVGFGLNDSPAGLAAWIVEKFRAWSDCGGDVESTIAKDRMLANISLYWFTGCIGASFWPYYARMHGPWPIPDGGPIAVPTAYAAFPTEIVRPPRSLAKRTYTDIRQWSVMKTGGHFAAMEQPEALARDLLDFLRPLRERSGTGGS